MNNFDTPNSWDDDYRKLWIDLQHTQRRLMRYRNALYHACGNEKEKVEAALEYVDQCNEEQDSLL